MAVTDGGTISLLLTEAAALSPSSDCEFLLVVVLFVCMALAISSPNPSSAILRETSTVFAALIGWLALKETVGPRRIALMALIALGAVIVEMGG